MFAIIKMHIRIVNRDVIKTNKKTYDKSVVK